MRLLALTFFLVTAAAGPAGALTLDAAEPVTIKGAHGLILVPAGWRPETGGLFLYAHGYTADPRTIRPYPADITGDNLTTKLTGGDQVLQIPLNLGYAAVTTTYRSVGWAVADAVKDIENLRRYFVRRYGQPKRTYIWGHSEGGMVTQAVAELARRHYDAALPFCAPGAGARRNFAGGFDLRAVFEHVCRDVPEARFVCRLCSGGTARCLDEGDCPTGETCGAPEAPPKPEDGLTEGCAEFLLEHPEKVAESPGRGDFVGRVVEACFGGDAPTPPEAARKDLFLRATRIPESFLGTDMFFGSVGIAEIFHRRTGGRHGWGNALVDYASPELSAAEHQALNAGVPRALEDEAAIRYLRRFYEPRGGGPVRRSWRCTPSTTGSSSSRTRRSTARRSSPPAARTSSSSSTRVGAGTASSAAPSTCRSFSGSRAGSMGAPPPRARGRRPCARRSRRWRAGPVGSSTTRRPNGAAA
jgi:hypothetical protein